MSSTTAISVGILVGATNGLTGMFSAPVRCPREEATIITDSSFGTGGIGTFRCGITIGSGFTCMAEYNTMLPTIAACNVTEAPRVQGLLWVSGIRACSNMLG